MRGKRAKQLRKWCTRRAEELGLDKSLWKNFYRHIKRDWTSGEVKRA